MSPGAITTPCSRCGELVTTPIISMQTDRKSDVDARDITVSLQVESEPWWAHFRARHPEVVVEPERRQ